MLFERVLHQPRQHPPRIVSMQSHVAFGHVGNAVAQFVLQRSGCEVIPLHTVLYSSHLGYPEWRGRGRSVEELCELIEGLDAIGALASQDALLTGFLGDAEHADLAMELHHTQMSGAWLCVDPVMGDHGSLYVHRDLVEIYRTKMPGRADVLIPNMFELELLADEPVSSVAQASHALATLHAIHSAATPHHTRRLEGGPLCIVKGVQDRAYPESLFVLARCNDEELILKTPKLEGFFAGAGDLFSATLVASLLGGASADQAIERATNTTFYVLEQTRALGRKELALISSQAVFDAPLEGASAQRGPATRVKWRDGEPGSKLVDVQELYIGRGVR